MSKHGKQLKKQVCNRQGQRTSGRNNKMLAPHFYIITAELGIRWRMIWKTLTAQEPTKFFTARNHYLLLTSLHINTQF